MAARPQCQFVERLFALTFSKLGMHDFAVYEEDAPFTIAILQMEDAALSVGHDQLHGLWKIQL